MDNTVERKLATIRRIDNIDPIEGADKIVKATIGGWSLVTAIADGFAVGDHVVYVEIDSFLPTELAPFLTKPGYVPHEFNGVKGERLRTIRLRKTISQGLILPLSVLDEVATTNGYEYPALGTDVTQALNIQKYEKELPACLSGLARGSFPSFGRKTDQERIENLSQDGINEALTHRYEITLKLDGSSCSVYANNGDIGVCSRNLDLKINEENAGNSFVATATDSGLMDALRSLGKNIMVSGELMGPGIQGNREQLSKCELYVFDVFDIDTQQYLAPAARVATLALLRQHGYTGNVVPVIESNVLLQDVGIVDSVTSKAYVDRSSINAAIAEGCVFKREDGQFSFKSINNKFLLKCED